MCVCVYVCAFVCDRWSTIRPGSPLLKVSLTTQRDGWTGVSFSSSWAQYRFENITNVPNTFDQAYPLCKKNNNKQESSAPQMAERDVQDRHSSLQLQKNKLRWISFRLHCVSDCQRTANQPRPDSHPSMDIGVDFGGPPSRRRGCVCVCLLVNVRQGPALLEVSLATQRISWTGVFFCRCHLGAISVLQTSQMLRPHFVKCTALKKTKASRNHQHPK